MCAFIVSTTFVSNIFHSKKNEAKCDQKYILVFMQSTLYSCPILMKPECSGHSFETILISNFKKIRPLGAEMFHAGLDEANSRFSQFGERA